MWRESRERIRESSCKTAFISAQPKAKVLLRTAQLGLKQQKKDAAPQNKGNAAKPEVLVGKEGWTAGSEDLAPEDGGTEHKPLDIS